MRVLVACEESQTVCKAFRERGHEAYSCDIQPPSGGHPEWHIQDDVLRHINPCAYSDFYGDYYGIYPFSTMDGKVHIIGELWDLIIAHPPCTYLSNAGARWLFAGGSLNQERYNNGIRGKEFFIKLLNAKCHHVAVENPIPSRIYEIQKPTQIIQPYEFGEPWSKRTCLWLKGLPPLIPTEVVENHRPYCTSGSYTRCHDPKYKGASRVGGSAKSRSKTFQGIAKAMAEQWGGVEP